MRISEHIEILKKALVEHGDQELYMIGNSVVSDWVFPVVVPKMKIVYENVLTGEYNINPAITNDGNLLVIKNLHSFDSDNDSIETDVREHDFREEYEEIE